MFLIESIPDVLFLFPLSYFYALCHSSGSLIAKKKELRQSPHLQKQETNVSHSAVERPMIDSNICEPMEAIYPEQSYKNEQDALGNVIRTTEEQTLVSCKHLY